MPHEDMPHEVDPDEVGSFGHFSAAAAGTGACYSDGSGGADMAPKVIRQAGVRGSGGAVSFRAD